MNTEQLNITNRVSESPLTFPPDRPVRCEIGNEVQQQSQAPLCIKEFVKIPVWPDYSALIDPEDFVLVSQFRWRVFIREKLTYAVTGKATLLHRLILGAGEGDGQRIDHHNGNGLDCRRLNLRFSTQSQNRANSRKYAKCSSDFKGVMAAHGGKWRVYCGTRTNRFYLGLFTNEIEAALAYDRKAIELYGPFACLNFPDRRAA